MKKWMMAIAAFLMIQGAFAQNELPPYKKSPTLPQLQLMQVDSSTLTNGQLKKEPTIIMYFSPSCDHCQHQVKDMIAAMKDLQQYQILMATYQPFDEMTEFYKEYKLAQYPNIKMGRDVNYRLPVFFDIRNLPYLALYDKNGALITTFEGNVKVDALIKAFK